MRVNVLAGWALLFASYLACVFAAGLGWIDVPAGSPLHGYRVHAAALPLFGVAAGLAIILLGGGTGATDGPEPALGLSRGVRGAVLTVAVVALAIALLGGAATPALGGLRAGVLLVCGTVTLLLAFAALERLLQEDGLTFESHWGGLGGNLGGWRISTAVALVGLLLVFAGATVAVALAPPAAEEKARPAAAPPGGEGKAPAKPGRGAARPSP